MRRKQETNYDNYFVIDLATHLISVLEFYQIEQTCRALLSSSGTLQMRRQLKTRIREIACNYTSPGKWNDYYSRIICFIFFCPALNSRWLLWIDEETNDCRRMGMGLVAGNRRSASVT